MKPLLLLLALTFTTLAAEPALTLARTENWLVIQGPHLPGEIRIN